MAFKNNRKFHQLNLKMCLPIKIAIESLNNVPRKTGELLIVPLNSWCLADNDDDIYVSFYFYFPAIGTIYVLSMCK